MTDSTPIIEVRDVSKRFRLQQQRGESTLKGWVVDALRGHGRMRDFWALQDVSLEVKAGETVGIIGANGAGKSTLLSLISKTSQPTSGHIRTRGKVSSLLELGAGFHPDLTGRENVFLYGSIMGLSRRQMEERFDDIIAFSEMAEWIDEPVKHYSSGMYVRLAFSVAVEVDPDVLIIDEVLAVGDASFQRKCVARIDAFKKAGKTLLVVSHDLGTIHTISDRLVLMDRGKILATGSPDDVVAEYQYLSRRNISALEKREWGTGEVKIKAARFLDGAGKEAREFWSGHPLHVEIDYEATGRVDDPVFGFAIHSTSGILVFGNNTQIEGVDIPYVEGKGTIALSFERMELLTGGYLFSFSIHSQDHLTNYHRLDYGHPIMVRSERRYEGVAYMPVQWQQRKG